MLWFGFLDHLNLILIIFNAYFKIIKKVKYFEAHIIYDVLINNVQI